MGGGTEGCGGAKGGTLGGQKEPENPPPACSGAHHMPKTRTMWPEAVFLVDVHFSKVFL